MTAAVAYGCSDPQLETELNSAGAPELTMINILSETLGETATYCMNGTDVKVHKDFCPEHEGADGRPIPGMRDVEPIADAQPLGWYLRIVFSELLFPGVEQLIEEDLDGDGVPETLVGHIDATLPVVLSCNGKPVAYDGFYDPSGNDVTYPPGPALIINPKDFVATGTTNCSVEVKDMVTDKDGNSVVPEQRGPYTFGIAALAVMGADPPDMSEGVDPTSIPTIAFNAPIQSNSIGGKVQMSSGGADVAVTLQLDEEDPTLIQLVPDAGELTPNTTYTVQVDGGITDIAGGPLELSEPEVFTFTTGEPTPDEGM